jgi:hypothetical protein
LQEATDKKQAMRAKTYLLAFAFASELGLVQAVLALPAIVPGAAFTFATARLAFAIGVIHSAPLLTEACIRPFGWRRFGW